MNPQQSRQRNGRKEGRRRHILQKQSTSLFQKLKTTHRRHSNDRWVNFSFDGTAFRGEAPPPLSTLLDQQQLLLFLFLLRNSFGARRGDEEEPAAEVDVTACEEKDQSIDEQLTDIRVLQHLFFEGKVARMSAESLERQEGKGKKACSVYCGMRCNNLPFSPRIALCMLLCVSSNKCACKCI